MPHAEKAKVDNEKDIESNKQWETYCLGTMEIISTQDSIQYNKVKENIDLQKLFKDLNEKQLNAVLNNIRNNVPDVTSKEKKSDLPDGYDDGPDL
jgi:predicted lipoprotein